MDTPPPEPGPGLLAPSADPDQGGDPDEPVVLELDEPEADESGEPGPGPPDDIEEAEEAVVAPPVVAVLVTADPGPWLEDALTSLAGQVYPALSVLVLDNNSAEDPTPRIAAASPRTFVRRLPENIGFAAAANDALATIEGATFLLFCHDDVVLAPDAVRVMVEEAYRSNAAIVGPKLVDYDDPNVLLEVGMAVDHYGVPFSGIEPGEVDQEQHDAVRDVFFVSNAAMLVRSDLFHELAGFDPATFPGFDDVDLCWRARLAGARVLVAPEARVRHRRTTLQDERPSRYDDQIDLEAWTRGRIRVLLKSYSGLALIWVIPVAFVLNLVEAAALVLARRPGRAGALLGGWFDNLRQLPDVRRARKEAQRLRRVDDGDVRDLMVRGSARLRAFFAHRLHASDRIAEMSNRTREAATEVRTRLRAGHVVLALLVALIVIVGSRSFVLDRVPEVGQFRAWPSMGDLWSTFFSPWRYAMVGADAPGPPVFGLMAALSTVLFGDTDLARTLVIAGAFPLGAWGAFRLTRPLAPSALPAVVAALAYVANPVVRNAIGEGHFGPLVAYALAPFILNSLSRASAVEVGRRARVHSTLAVALGIAVIAAAWPPGLIIALVIAVAFLLAVPFVGGLRLAGRALASAAAATALAFVLLAPWSIDLLGARSASFGLLPRSAAGFVDVITFQTGRAGSGLAPWGLIVAGLLPLAVATGPRLAWAVRAWMLTIVAWLAAWLPARLDATGDTLATEGVLVLAALGLALAVGLGVATITEELRTFRFGWRQVAAAVAAIGLALPLIGLTADALQGRWGLSHEDWNARFAWMTEDATAGEFRVLWLGDPTILPGDAHVAAGTGYLLTRDGPGDVRDLWTPPENDAEATLADSIDVLRSGGTVRFGHLLAPAAIRYVVILDRAAPTSGRRIPADAILVQEISGQLDLTLSRIESDAIVYENEAWIARAAGTDANVPTDVDDPLFAASRFDGETSAVTDTDQPLDVDGETLLWSEAADDGWEASVDSNDAPRSDAFGWTNAFPAGDGSVSVEYESGLRRVFASIELLLWLAVAIVWWRTRARRQETA